MVEGMAEAHFFIRDKAGVPVGTVALKTAPGWKAVVIPVSSHRRAAHVADRLADALREERDRCTWTPFGATEPVYCHGPKFAGVAHAPGQYEKSCPECMRWKRCNEALAAHERLKAGEPLGAQLLREARESGAFDGFDAVAAIKQLEEDRGDGEPPDTRRDHATPPYADILQTAEGRQLIRDHRAMEALRASMARGLPIVLDAATRRGGKGDDGRWTQWEAQGDRECFTRDDPADAILAAAGEPGGDEP